MKIMFSGIVVTYNEARHLRACLNSLAFCKQLLVIDLGSEDESVEIAQECGAEVVRHERVPVVEHIWPLAVSLAQGDWIIRADPDEIFPLPLVKELSDMIATSNNLAMISIPHQYHFKGLPVSTTVWGANKYIPKVFHKQRVLIRPLVGRGIIPKDSFEIGLVGAGKDNVIQHFWADSYWHLFKKHWRYVKQEGEGRYKSGQRFTWRKWASATYHNLKKNLVECNGWKGGWMGIFLSFFYACYINASLLSLLWYQKKRVKEG